MGNYRSKLCRAGCLEISINGGKRRGQQPQRNIKTPKRSEIYFLPNFPDGEDKTSMESTRKEMVEDMTKRHPNASLIAKNMNSTFALRRKELIEMEPGVKDTVERWPALFTESQVSTFSCVLVNVVKRTKFGTSQCLKAVSISRSVSESLIHPLIDRSADRHGFQTLRVSV